jgi:hypothetical protein
MAPKNNVALLTEGQAYIQRAKKARQDQVEEIKFDDAARRCVRVSQLISFVLPYCTLVR